MSFTQAIASTPLYCGVSCAGEREQAEGVQEQPGGVPPRSQRKEAQGAAHIQAAWAAKRLIKHPALQQEGSQQQRFGSCSSS
jgi:hypothetical protein